MMQQDEMKKAVAHAALEYVEYDMVLGVGTGSTVNHFIDALAPMAHKIKGAVSSSHASTERLKALGIEVFDPNSQIDIPVYIDGADEVNQHLQMIKGGGGALTSEKIVACLAKKFICLADETKRVDVLGAFPVAIEVLPMARSYVARELVKLGGQPVYRQGFVTDHGNVILDTHNLTILNPLKLEEQLNNITGVVANGIFARNKADVLLLGTSHGVERQLAQ